MIKIKELYCLGLKDRKRTQILEAIQQTKTIKLKSIEKLCQKNKQNPHFK